MRRIHADLLLLLAAVIWGVAFVFQKAAMEHIGPNTFIAARGFLAAIALAPLAVLEARRLANVLPLDLLRTGVWGGALFFIGALFQQLGLLTATVGNTGFLTGLYVVITPLIAWLWVRERPSGTVGIAVVLSFIGTWLLGGGTITGFNRGDGLVAISAVFWAIHLTITAAAAQFNRPITFTAIQFTIVGGVGLMASVLTEATTFDALIAAAPAIAYVGLLSSALTFTLVAIAMKHVTTIEVVLIVSLETVIAALAGAALLGERLSLIAGVGAALILVAIILVQVGATSARAPAKEQCSA